jgi:hypothetical protein
MRDLYVKVTARGFPWQSAGMFWANQQDKTVGKKYGWNHFRVIGMGRFGGGWAFKLGVMFGSGFDDFIFSLGIGEIRIQIKSREKDMLAEIQRQEYLAMIAARDLTTPP